MLETQYLGYAAGILTTLAFLPQAFRIIRTRQTRDISLLWALAMNTGIILWLLYGIAKGMDWRATGQLASLMGALKIGARGGQNHQATRSEIEALYRRHFNAQLV